MSAADGFRRVLYSARSIASSLGLRPYTAVSVVVGTWDGTYTGSGDETQTTVSLTEAGGHPPRVRAIDEEQRMISSLPSGSIEVGPITPSFSGGGNLLSTLKPALSSGQTLSLLVTVPDGNTNQYEIVEINDDSALHFTIRAKPVSLT